MRELFTRSRMVKDVVIAPLSTTNATDLKYKEAIRILNSLQSTAKCIQEQKSKRREIELKNVGQSRKYLERCGVTLDKLDTLSIIHVAGTKGKGSTSAFCESVLRHHGYRTGFFSSPHLVCVQERVRIDGRPLSPASFAAHVTRNYERLHAQREDEHDMPAFFKFLSTVAFTAFLEEGVDVAIVEVGVGGEYDCTNVIREVAVVGITSLGLDHTSILGNTIEEIAWQKAGIMKPGCVAFTTDDQPPAAMAVLRERAAERQCRLLVSPPLGSYDWGRHCPQLGIPSEVQKVNASLALQLANHWIRHRGCSMNGIMNGNMNGNGVAERPQEMAPAFPVTSAMARGLKHCQWPGRTQTITRGLVTYYLDGAHTPESMQVCADWFRQATQDSPRSVQRVLLFNTTGDRNAAHFLEMLAPFDFQLALFCSNNVTATPDTDSDLQNLNVTDAQQAARCEKHLNVWRSLHPAPARLLPCVADALAALQALGGRADVLVTGSLHLVGGVLSLVDPDLADTAQHATLRADNKV